MSNNIEINTPKTTMLNKRLIPYFIRALILVSLVVLLWQLASVIFSSIGSNGPLIENRVQDAHADAVTIDVYYESMCPDSKYFIQKQLFPAFQKVPEIMNVQFKPYGKARTIENSTGIYFQCQHQAEECQGNKIHACGIKYIEDRTVQTNFVFCLIGNIRNPSSAAGDCARQANVDWEAIKTCAWSEEGSLLLKLYGEETHALRPGVTFIPTVVLDGNQGTQSLILKNFLQELCKAYQGTKPDQCTK